LTSCKLGLFTFKKQNTEKKKKKKKKAERKEINLQPMHHAVWVRCPTSEVDGEHLPRLVLSLVRNVEDGNI
jgi:hypothetical protein